MDAYPEGEALLLCHRLKELGRHGTGQHEALA